MKKLIPLLILMVMIIKFSNTSELRVLEPSTWFNETKYEENIKDLSFVTNIEGGFFNPYDKAMLTEPNFISHKLSHVFFYSLLTYLLYINLGKLRFKYVYTLVGIHIFAFIDEIHQFFIVGRSGRMNDVILDTIAGLFTLTIIYFVKRSKNLKKIKKEEKNYQRQT